MKLFKVFGIVFLILISMVSVFAIPTDYTAFWKFDNNLNDNSLNNNDLTLAGAGSEYYVEMDKGTAVVLNGTSLGQYVYINDADQTGLEFNTDFTISFWNYNYDGNPRWISKYGASGTRTFNLNVDTSSNLVYMRTSTAGTAIKSDTVAMTLVQNDWEHYTITYDISAGLGELYRNNVLVGTFTGLDTTIFNSGSPVEINSFLGGESNNAYSNFFVYDRVVTSDERTELFEYNQNNQSFTNLEIENKNLNLTPIVNTSNPNFNISFSENGSLYYSNRLNSSDEDFNHGTLTNFAINNGIVNGGVTIEDGAMVFDGVNGNYVDTNLVLSDIQTADVFSVAIWFTREGTLTSRLLFENFNNAAGSLQIYQPTTTTVRSDYKGVVTQGGVTLLDNNLLVVTFNNGTITQYLNDVQVSTATGSLVARGNEDAQNIFIGARPRNGGELVWEGTIPKVEVYKDKILSSSERTEIYNAGKDVYSPIGEGLVAQYTGKDFEGTEDAPTTIYDTNYIVNTGIENISNGINFNGVDEYISLGNNLNDFENNPFSISATINLNQRNVRNTFLSKGLVSDGDLLFYQNNNAGGQISFYSDSGNIILSTTDYSINQNHIINVIYDGSNAYLYIDNILKDSHIGITGYNQSNMHNWIIGAGEDGTQRFMNGSISNLQIYNISLNNTQRNKILNGEQVYEGLVFQQGDILVKDQTLLDRMFKICEYCETATFQLTNLFEKTYKIGFQAVSSTFDVFTGFLTYTADTTLPTINNTLPGEINSYDLNVSEFVSCEDLNLLSCNINFTTSNQTTPSSNTSFTFNRNGNISYIITAEDTAGNTQTDSGVILVNPYQRFYFENNVTSSLINEYKVFNTANTSQQWIVNGTQLQIPLYDLGLGNHTLTFEKFGFDLTNFSVSFNLTSLINQTIVINPVTVTIQMFDFYTNDQITFDITIIGPTQNFVFENQTNFSKTYAELEGGELEFIISAQNYTTAKYYNTLTPFTSIFISGLLTPTADSDVIVFTVRDFSNNNPLDNTLIDIQRLIGGQYVTVVQALTDSDGQTFVNLDSTQEYRFVFSREGYVNAVVNSIPGVLSYTVRLKLEETQFEFLDGINYVFLPVNTILEANESHNFRTFISGTSITESRFKITLNDGTVITEQTNTNPSGTEFNFNYSIPDDGSVTSIVVELTYFINGKSNTITKRYTVINIDRNNFISLLRDYALDDRTFGDNFFRWVVMMTIFGSILVASVAFAVTAQYASLTFMIPLIIFTLIGWIPWVYFAILTTLLLVIWRYNVR